MKKKNKLSLFRLDRKASYYIRHPWKLFHELWWNVRNFFHRGRYGYAYTDVWGFYHWWTTVGAEAMRYLAEHGCGYPGIEPWETKEKWKAYLLNMADQLDWCAESCDIIPEDHHTRNPYYEQMLKIREKRTELTKDENGYLHTLYSLSEEEENAEKLYWEREKELDADDDYRRRDIFNEVGKNLGRFWD